MELLMGGIGECENVLLYVCNEGVRSFIGGQIVGVLDNLPKGCL